jgi:magnesium chelatase family protein
LAGSAPGTSSETMRAQVAAARQRQRQRYHDERDLYNSKLKSKLLRQFCQLDATGIELMRSSVNELGLSARAHDKVLRVARTIADLEDSDNIQLSHLQEAINFRMLDRDIWT